jgi:AraC-like DNA-binding protein
MPIAAGTQMAELTVGAGSVSGLVEFAVSRGADRRALLDRAGLTPQRLDDHDNRIPVASYVRLMRAAKALCGDPALALHFAEAVDLSQISIVGLLGHASATMIEAFGQLNRYGRLAFEVETADGGDRFRHVWRWGRQWLVDYRKDPDAFYEQTESTFARMVCGTRRFGDTPFVEAVHVTHPDPGYREAYERILGAPVTFGADWNAMMIDERWHQHRIALQPRYALGVLSQHADALLETLEAARTVRGQVEAILTPMLPTRSASVAAVAAGLGQSRQTLFRRLKAEGVTFRQVLDDLRRRLALDHLTNRQVTVYEAGYRVGFSDPAAFSRAFKRWTGVSPREMRRTRAQTGPPEAEP